MGHRRPTANPHRSEPRAAGHAHPRRRRGVQQAAQEGPLLQIQEAPSRPRKARARRTLPLHHYPIMGTGGTDKPDNPSEKRIVGDAGAPHPEQEVREQNHPHEQPRGPVQISINDMMGPPPGTTPRGQRLDASRYPMPDPETKPRPRHVYNDKCVLQHMAWVNKTYLAGFKSDGRHMFFQFEMAPEAERTCCFVVIVELLAVDEDGAPVLTLRGGRWGSSK